MGKWRKDGRVKATAKVVAKVVAKVAKVATQQINSAYRDPMRQAGGHHAADVVACILAANVRYTFSKLYARIVSNRDTKKASVEEQQ